MDEEAVIPAPVTDETASPAPASVSEEVKPEAEKPAKTFTQDELDAAISKRLAREERKWQRELERVATEAKAPKQPEPQRPNPESFKTTEEYLESLADWKAEQKVTEALSKRDEAAKKSEATKQIEAVVTAFTQKEEAIREKHADYDAVVRDPDLPITDAMARTIQESDNGPELAYFLGKNPGEAARIAKLSPFLQAKELGRLEAKLPQEAPKKTSSAPEPITPVNARGSQPVYDTTDPRSTKQMSTSEWIAAEEKRMRAKLEAQGYR
jgi:hypothetical protein